MRAVNTARTATKAVSFSESSPIEPSEKVLFSFPDGFFHIGIDIVNRILSCFPLRSRVTEKKLAGTENPLKTGAFFVERLYADIL